MSKKIMESEDKKESVLDRITNFFKANKGAAVQADDEDENAAVADDDDSEADAAKADEDEDMSKKEEDKDAAQADSADPDDDDDDSDEDDKQDDSDEDDVEINGKVFNLADPKQVLAAINEQKSVFEAQIEEKDKMIAEQNSLLEAAQGELSQKDAQIAKTATEIKKEIKSAFVPKASSRTHRVGEKPDGQVEEIVPGPKEGSYAEKAILAVKAMKASKKA